MKRNQYNNVALLAFALAFISFSNAFGQVPIGFSYQAVLTDKNGEAISGSVGLKISLLQGAEMDKTVYSERHNVISDINGLTSVIIGGGDEVYTGNLVEIDWSQGPFFIKTEISTTGGFNYNIQTISELVSVPYSLHAQRAGELSATFEERDPVFSNSIASTITEADISEWNSLSTKALHFIGEEFGGGIVFYIESSGEHGLIVSKMPFDDLVVWGASMTDAQAMSTYDGLSNTAAIVNAYGDGDYAAKKCTDFTSEGLDDWYLPSVDELKLLMKAAYEVDKSGLADGLLWSQDYWTSTEIDDTTVFSLGIEGVTITSKSEVKGVLAIRAF